MDRIWRHGQVVRRGTANPLSPVQIRVSPDQQKIGYFLSCWSKFDEFLLRKKQRQRTKRTCQYLIFITHSIGFIKDCNFFFSKSGCSPNKPVSIGMKQLSLINLTIGSGHLFYLIEKSNKRRESIQGFRTKVGNLGIRGFLKGTPFLVLELKKRLYDIISRSLKLPLLNKVVSRDTVWY